MTSSAPEFRLHPPWFLLPDSKQVDVGELFWNLEKTVEKNPEKWGWLDKACSVCGNTGVVVWDQRYGYRCEKDRV